MCIDFCKSAKAKLRAKLEAEYKEATEWMQDENAYLTDEVTRLTAELVAEKARPKRPEYCRPVRRLIENAGSDTKSRLPHTVSREFVEQEIKYIAEHPSQHRLEMVLNRAGVGVEE